MPDKLIGQVLGDYTIQELLGRGGMARVYRGYDEHLDRYAAIKVIDAVGEEDLEEYKARFMREARAIARLVHPNIVGVYQFGQVESDEEQNFMAMHFIEGRDLRHILKENSEKGVIMPLEEVLSIIKDIASALDYAHKEGVIHRDIKPSNIMVTPGNKAILTDFGLALNLPEGTIGNTFGSAHYISPEQAISSAQAVPQSDLYSLGVVLYEMLTGKVPFDDPSTMSVALKHLQEPPPAPRLLNPAITPAVEDVVMRALRKEPSDRHANGAAMAEALAAAIYSQDVPFTSDDINATAEIAAAPGPAIPEIATRPNDVEAMPSDPVKDANTETLLYAPGQSASPPPAEPAPAEEKSGRRGLLIGLLAVVAVIALGAILLNGGGAAPTATPNADATGTAGAAAAVAAADTATPSDTPAPTDAETPTEAPSDTPEPTETPTDTPEPTATNTPTPTVTETAAPATLTADAEDADFMLVYDEDSLLLVNLRRYAMDISFLEFRRENPDRPLTPYFFLAEDWSGGVYPPTALPGGDCFQLWRMGQGLTTSDVPYDDYCDTRAAYREVSRLRWFWLHPQDDGISTFDVMIHYGDVLQTCEIDAGRCYFNLP